MAVCDICSKTMIEGEGYTLTTKQVVTVPAYWTQAFMGAAAAVSIMPPDMVRQTFEQQIRQQCGQTTGWLTCEECIAKFPEVDREQARVNAQEFWSQGGGGSYSPPGGGAVDSSVAIAAASQAWKQATGTAAPRTSTGGDVGGGCFIATAACGSSLAEEVIRLREFRERVLRPSPLGRTMIRTYEFVSPPLANQIARSRVARAIVRVLVVRPASLLGAAALWRTRADEPAVHSQVNTTQGLRSTSDPGA